MLAERFGVDPALLRSANVGVPLPEADDVDVSQSVHSIIVPSGAKGGVATIGLEKCELEKCELVVFPQAGEQKARWKTLGPFPEFHDEVPTPKKVFTWVHEKPNPSLEWANFFVPKQAQTFFREGMSRVEAKPAC